jgi:hypothetical protein
MNEVAVKAMAALMVAEIENDIHRGRLGVHELPDVEEQKQRRSGRHHPDRGGCARRAMASSPKNRTHGCRRTKMAKNASHRHSQTSRASATA